MNHILPFNAFILIIIGLMSIYKSRTKIALYFFLMSCGYAFWNLAFYFYTLVESGATFSLSVVLRADMLAMLLFANATYLFSLEYRFARISRTQVYFPMLYTVILIYFIFHGELLEYNTAGKVVDILVEGPHYLVFSFYLIFVALFVAVQFGKVYILNNEKRNQVSYLILGFTLYVILGMVFDIILPIFGNTKLLIFGHLGALFLSSFFFVAITKHNLMDIRVIIKKGTSIIITTVAILAGFIVIYLNTSTMPFVQFVVYGAFLVFCSFFAIPIRDKLITGFKHTFIKSFYEPSDVIKDLTKTLHQEQNREAIFRTVAEKLYKTLQTREAIYCFAKRNHEGSVTAYSLKFVDNNTETTIAPDSKFIKYFLDHRDSCFMSELPDESRIELSGYTLPPSKTILLPLYSPEILEGVVILSQKEGRAFDSRDNDLFDQVSTLLTGIFYRLTPFEKIESAFNENQRQLYEAKTALIRAEKIQAVSREHLEVQHELKTPVSTIKMALHNYKKNPSEERLSNFLHKAQEQIDRLEYIINSSLGSSGQITRSFNKEDINAIVEEALLLLPDMESRVRFEQSEVKPKIMCAKGDIISVLINLIRNANTAMKEKPGDIFIKIFSEFNQVIIQVTDTGKGISEENIERIWEPFFTTELDTGHGLGLSISHNIIQRHNGSITVQSQIGMGTTFTMKLPLSA